MSLKIFWILVSKTKGRIVRLFALIVIIYLISKSGSQLHNSTAQIDPFDMSSFRENNRKVYQEKSEYDQEIPQSHTADQTTALRGRAQNTNSHKTSGRRSFSE